MQFVEQVEMLQGSVRPPKKEVSLKTITKKQKKKIMEAYKRGRDLANNFYESTVQPAIIKRKKIYDTPKELYRQKFPELSENSDWISKDVKTTIDWIIPALLDVFCGTDDPCDIQGKNLDDDEVAKRLQAIIKYQINNKNHYFEFLYNFIKEGMITNLGVAKVYWVRDEDRTEYRVMLDATNMEQFMQQVLMGKVEVKELEIIDNVAVIVTYDEIETHFNAPVIENLPPSELRFTPDGHTLQDCKYVAQRKIVKGDELKRKERDGIYQDVDKAIKYGGDSVRTSLDDYNNKYLKRYGADALSDNDMASKEVELYEAYLDVDYNNDGILEQLIVTAVGDIPICIQENTFKSVPFFIFAPEMNPYTVFGEASYADTLEQLQDLKTAIIRQVIIAVAKNNRPQRFVAESKVDMGALLNGEEFVPVHDGNPAEAVLTSPHIPLDGTTMTLVEYAQNEIESQSGSTRYNQGLNSDSLNKTASGINTIIGQTDKKMRLLARIFAETAWCPILKHIIRLDQQFLTPYQQFRLNDEMVSISPDELDIDYDLVVNTGQGAATKEAQMNYIIMLMHQLFPALEQRGVVTEKSWFETSKDLLEKMGVRNVQKYFLDPDSQEFKQLQQQRSQQAQQAKMEELEMQKEIAKFKMEYEIQKQSIPRFAVNYEDLPVQGKQIALDKYLNAEIPTEQFVQKEEYDVMRGSND